MGFYVLQPPRHHTRTAAAGSSEADSAQSYRFVVSVMEIPTVNGEPKSVWPELVGKTAEEAREVLQREAPGHSIVVLKHDMCITADYRTDRIQVWLDTSERVARPPAIG